MTPREIRNLIKIAASTCMARDAETFTSLFTADAELFMSGHQIVGKAAIKKATTDYLTTCEQIQVNIHQIIVENNQALVEWTWEDIKVKTGQRNRTDNAIVIKFKDGLICRWREYSNSK